MTAPRGFLAMLWLLTVLVACGGSPPEPLPPAWQPQAALDCHAELSATKVVLLSPVDLTVRVQCPEKLELPLAKQIPTGFLGTAETTVVQRGEGWLHTVTFHLRPSELGELEIESMQVEHGGETVTTSKLVLEVVSSLGEGDDPKRIEGQAALLPEPVWWPYAVVALAVVAVVVLWWWWSRRPRPQAALPVEVPVPAHVKAMRALQGVQHPTSEPEIDAFYVEVSQILRIYLEERFGLHAPTRSTEEFLLELERGDSLGLDHRQSLRNFLQQCDLVKFARLLPGTEVHQQTLRVASTVVEETRADLLGGGVA